MADAVKADSFLTALNKEVITKARQIKVAGIKNLTDTILSIYNEEGILAAANFDKNFAYTYELALPIKYLNPKAVNASQINYNIRLNGSARAEGALFEHIEGGMRVSSPTLRSKDLPAIKDMELISVPTDVSGVYTIAP